MLKGQIIRIMFAANLMSFGAQAGIFDDTELGDCCQGKTTVSTTAYKYSIWMGETASYAQAVGTLDIVLGAENFTIGTGTAIAPNLVLASAHGYLYFQSGIFQLNGVEYEIDDITFCPSQETLETQKGAGADDLAILHLKSPVALKDFPILAAEGIAPLSNRTVAPRNQGVEAWCVSGGYITENLKPDHEEIKRHVTYAKLYPSHPKYPEMYYSKFKTARNMQQTPYTGESAYPLFPGYEVDKNEHLLAGPLTAGDSGAPVFIAARSGHRVSYKLTAVSSQLYWGDCSGNSCWDAKRRIFKTGHEFHNVFTSIAHNKQWLRKILKQHNAQAYQSELFSLGEV